jgi:hypothetical protein
VATVNSCNFQAFVVKRTKKTIGVHFLGFEKWNDENIRVKDISSRVRKRSKFTEIGPLGRESLSTVKSIYNVGFKIQSDHTRVCPKCRGWFLKEKKTSSKKTVKSVQKKVWKCRYCQADIMKSSSYFGCSACDKDAVAVCNSCIKFHFCRNNHKCQVGFLEDEETLGYQQNCGNCAKRLRCPSVVLVCHICDYYVCTTCAGCVTCHHRSAYGLHSSEVPLFIKSQQNDSYDSDAVLENDVSPKNDKSLSLAKINCLEQNPTVVSWNRNCGKKSLAAVAFEDTFVLLYFAELEDCALKSCEIWKHKQGNPDLKSINKIKWGSHRVTEKGQHDISKMVCMLECSNGIFFFLFDSIENVQTVQASQQFGLHCDSPVADYGFLSPYIAWSDEDQCESCIIGYIQNGKLQRKSSYTKNDINISAIAFCPPMPQPENSTWLTIGTTSGVIMILTFSGEESPVCVYSFNQRVLGAVSMISSCPVLTQASQRIPHSGDWRDQSETRFYCATDADSCEAGRYKMCEHGASESIIHESHWSCCGVTSPDSDCTNASSQGEHADKTWTISFATCFESGIFALGFSSCVLTETS